MTAPRSKKAVAYVFPGENCGVCKFSHVPEAHEKDELMCWVNPPELATDTDEAGVVGAIWIRGGFVEAQMPACHLFQPRLHS